MQGRVKDTVSVHGLHKRARGLVHARLTIVCLSKDLDQTLLMSWPYLLVFGPPAVGVIEESLQSFLIILLLELLLSNYLVLRAQLGLGHVGHEIEVQLN